MPRIAFFGWSVVALCSLPLCGCGGNPATVSGKIILDGRPLHTGTVTFHPVVGGAPAYGRIAENGRYSITTGSAEGLVLGDYLVTVMATEVVPAASRGEAPSGRPITPTHYADLAKSKLRFTVQKGENQFDIELKLAVSGKVTVNDAPLSSGTVRFHPPDGGEPVSAAIANDGSYLINPEGGLARGDYRVTVIAKAPPESDDDQPKELLPARYGDPEQSGLRVTVKPGAVVLNIALEGESS